MFQISLFMAEEKSDGQLSFEVRQQIALEKMMNQLNFFDMTLKCDPQVDCNGSGTCINQPKNYMNQCSCTGSFVGYRCQYKDSDELFLYERVIN